MAADVLDSDRYVSQNFVVRRFGVTERTIRAWRATPELNFPTPLFVGNKYRYLFSEILAWEKANRATPSKVKAA